MIALIGGQKGGTGKTTLATNLAALLACRGGDVLLVDGNAAQGTASNWASRRDETDRPKVPCVEKSGNIHSALKDLSGRYRDIIVDTGGQDSKEFRTALIAADLLITPIRPSQADVETLLYVSDLVEQARELNPGLKAWILITNAPPHPAVKLVDETRDLLGTLGAFHLMKSVIYNRKAYIDAMPAGLGVTEIGNAKASAEIEAIAMEIWV
jgi:chromosome partitioning protein